MITEQLGQSDASLLLAGDMTDELAASLARSLSKLRIQYCYGRVELELNSLGGALSALNRCIAALEEARAGGMRVDTLVRSRAASAAALLASLGDRRVAAPSARLLYHNVRAAGGGEVTAPLAASLGASLAGSDRWLARNLAVRSRAAGGTARGDRRFKVAEFAAADWPVVERLAGSGGRHGERLRALRRRVAEAARAPDGKPLAALYGELLTLDAWISARLAAELLLIDWVADASRREGRRGAGPVDGLAVPEWRALYPDDGTVPRAALCRHALVLGETGSGKTASGILPLVAAALGAESPVGCLLVIDPKREIWPEAARLAGGNARLIDPGSDGGPPRIDLMAGSLSPEGHLAAGRVETAARTMLVRAASLDPLNPARTLSGEAASHIETYWPQQGARLALSALSLALALSERRVEAFGDRTVSAALRGLPVHLRSACAAPGVEAGFLVEDPDVAAAAGAARRGLVRGGGPAGSVLEEFERAVRRTGLHRGSPAFRDEFDELVQKFRGALRENPEDAEPDPQLPLPLELPPERPYLALQALDGPWERRQAEEAERRAARNARAVEELAAAAVAAATRCVPKGRERATVNALAVADGLLQGLYGDGGDGGRGSVLDSDYDDRALADARRFGAAAVAERLRPVLGEGEAGAVLNEITSFWSSLAGPFDSPHYTSILGFAKLVFAPFAAPLPRKTLFFGCEPGFTAGAGSALDFAADVAARGPRAVHVVQPSLGAKDEALYARALKATFFEAVLDCPERAGPGGAEMPLVGYVADECHRFVTSDATHGEQSYLDTCRSFGSFCALACQSVSSLRHALHGRGEGAHEAAIDILLANTGTKLFFRSTERGTREALRWLCPVTPEGPPLVDVRPPSSLAPGECYAVLPDGRFERRQLAPYLRRAPGSPGARANPPARRRATPPGRGVGDG